MYSKQIFLGIYDGWSLEDVQINIKLDPRFTQFDIKILRKYPLLNAFLIEINVGTTESFIREALKIDFVLYANVNTKPVKFEFDDNVRLTFI